MTTVPPRFIPDKQGRIKLRTGDTKFLAEVAGVSVSTVSRIFGKKLRDRRTPSSAVRVALERALGVPLERVLPVR